MREQEPFDLESLRPHPDAIHRQIRVIARQLTEHHSVADRAEGVGRRLQELHTRAAQLALERDALARQQERALQAGETSRLLQERTQLVRDQLEQIRRDRHALEERSWALRRIQRDPERTLRSAI